MRLLHTILLMTLLLVPSAGTAEDAAPADFSAWLGEFRREALRQGIAAQTLDQAMASITYLPEVIAADRRQPEFKKTLDQYLSGALSAKRIDRGRHLITEERRLLKKITRRSAVQPRFLVALWGIESYYGQHTGKIPILSALATLAHDGRRGSYFRKELLNALKIVDAGHVSAERLLGSWAGAMGQMQFMPSTFLSYAVDGDGDKRIDLWGSRADVFASSANYLAKSGWNARQTWGREVLVPSHLDESFVGLKMRQPVNSWRKLGLRLTDGQPLPVASLPASLIQPEGPAGRSFLVYDNYQVLLTWNRSHSFAIAVGLLADELSKN